MKTNFPHTYQYLMRCRPRLAARPTKVGVPWYATSREVSGLSQCSLRLVSSKISSPAGLHPHRQSGYRLPQQRRDDRARCLQDRPPLPLGHSQQQRLLAIHPPHDPIHGMWPSGSTVVGCSTISNPLADDGRATATVRDDRRPCPAGYTWRRRAGCAGTDRRIDESPIRVRRLMESVSATPRTVALSSKAMSSEYGRSSRLLQRPPSDEPGGSPAGGKSPTMA